MKLLIFFLLFLLFTNNTIYAQNKTKFNIIVGANLTNPTQILEGSESPNFIGNYRPYGNIYASIMYKNRYIMGFGKEMNEYSFNSEYPKDFYIMGRVMFLKDTAVFKPYLEASYILNTYGVIQSQNINQFSYILGTGFIYNLNRIVSIDVGLGIQYREINYSYTNPSKLKSDISISTDRFMFKTGLIFKIY